MAWSDTATTVLRTLINDPDSTSYSDARLQTVLISCAYLISYEITFDTTYTIDVAAETITPDPSTDATFMNFMIMKAACQTDFSTFRTKALMDGISAKCGPAALSVIGNLKGFKELLTIGPCAAYQTMKQDYVFGNGYICQAILSPFIGSHFDPDSLGSTYVDNRDAYYT
jgi:hypothetical protein